MKNRLFFALCAMACATGAMAQTAGYVAGLHPDRRPDGAPQVTAVTRTPEQVERMLHGIVKPVPGNVPTIAAAGNWWIPLRQPGMNVPYDLRGWHGAAMVVPDAAVSTSASAAR